jgi:hypothetical protein
MLLYDKLKAYGSDSFPDDTAVFEISNVAEFCNDARDWTELDPLPLDRCLCFLYILLQQK